MNKRDLFYQDVLKGLSSQPKYLHSKYFYDEAGDKLFQKIMRCSDYYLTRCEEEILSGQSQQISEAVIRESTLKYDVIGLGAGDGSKTAHLLKAFWERDMIHAYFPVDISPHIIHMLEKDIPERFPGLPVKGWNGEYIQMLHEIQQHSRNRKIIFFLGSNIGNYTKEHALEFCIRLREQLNVGDFLFIGFDLKKHPVTILNAYQDKEGYTKAFNLNLLKRINRELQGDFDIKYFDHYAMYDPLSGSCRSFLISLKDQTVHIGQEFSVSFSENEAIHMEISQKYTIKEINCLAEDSSFRVIDQFFDSKKWFADCLWRKI